MKYKRGDIVWIYFPFSDLSQTKKRPALIISNDAVNNTGDYILLQITSKNKSDNLSIHLNESTYSDTPLGLDSYVRLHRAFTANESIIIRKDTAVKDFIVNAITDKLSRLISASIPDITFPGYGEVE